MQTYFRSDTVRASPTLRQAVVFAFYSETKYGCLFRYLPWKPQTWTYPHRPVSRTEKGRRPRMNIRANYHSSIKLRCSQLATKKFDGTPKLRYCPLLVDWLLIKVAIYHCWRNYPTTMPVPDKIRHVIAVMNLNCPRVCRPNDNLNALATDLPDPVRHIPVTVFRSVFTINNWGLEQ